MEISKTLARSLREVLLDGKWVTGTNLKKEITGLDWTYATKQVHSLNSIADLVFHLDYYLSGVLNVFNGGPLEIKDKHSFDYTSPKSQHDWDILTKKFCQNANNFIQVIEEMSDDTLEQNFVKIEYDSYFRNITLMSEHCYYHLGQIILIKKLINQELKK